MEIVITLWSMAPETALLPDGFRARMICFFLSDRSGPIDAYAVTVRDGAAAGHPRLIKDSLGVVKPVGWWRNSWLYIPQNRQSSIMMGTVDLTTGEIRNTVAVSDRYVIGMSGAQ